MPNWNIYNVDGCILQTGNDMDGSYVCDAEHEVRRIFIEDKAGGAIADMVVINMPLNDLNGSTIPKYSQQFNSNITTISSWKSKTF